MNSYMISTVPGNVQNASFPIYLKYGLNIVEIGWKQLSWLKILALQSYILQEQSKISTNLYINLTIQFL